MDILNITFWLMVLHAFMNVIFVCVIVGISDMPKITKNPMGGEK